MKLNEFVRERDRTGSPQPRGPTLPPTREQRAKLAAKSKVPSKGAALLHRQPGQQNSSARRQSGSTVNGPPAPQQQPQLQRSDDGESLQHDRYDTDAESLDTTTHGQSLIQAEVNQASRQQHYTQDGTDYSGSDDDSEGFEDEQHDEQLEHLPTIQELAERYHIQHFSPEDQVAFMRERNEQWWDDGNSYPTTTSGPPDGFPDNWTIEQDAPSEDKTQRPPLSPVNRPLAGSFARPSGQQSVARIQPVPELQQKMPKQTSIYQKSARIRQDQNVTTKVPTNNALQLSSQATAYDQVAVKSPTPTKAIPQQATAFQSNPFTSHGPRQSIGLPRAQPFHQPLVHHARPMESAVPFAPPVPANPKIEEPVSDHKPVTQDIAVEPTPKPFEDYDLPDLFQKEYNELKAEDFDTEPRGKMHVLSDDMNQKPLTERLAHVRERLDVGDQDKFFRALPTREWEDAGDWFLEQFNSIITRTREARQQKRKLATEFEDEIEKRYRYVAKRQHHVEGALDKMKTQGEGLVPKSPRASKSPKKT